MITWSSKKQATVALSTSEAKYVVATSAACQAIWLRRVLANLQQEQKGATKIFCDDKATISMTKNQTFTAEQSILNFDIIIFVILLQRKKLFWSIVTPIFAILNSCNVEI